MDGRGEDHIITNPSRTFSGVRCATRCVRLQDAACILSRLPRVADFKGRGRKQRIERCACRKFPLQAITARYDLGLDTDYNHIVWAFTPNVMSLHLYYGGADHHIRIEFNNNSQYYKSTADELKQSSSFLSFAKTGVALQLKAIYDGSTLIQRFGAVEGNYMHIFFDAE